MTRDEPPSPPPALPTTIIEHILATRPHFEKLESDGPIFSLLNVLPHKTVPSAYASLVSNAFAYSDGPDAAVRAALVRLFEGGNQWASAANRLVGHLKQALTRNRGDCLRVVTQLIAQTGRLDLLERIAAMDAVSLVSCNRVVHAAACNGHVRILQWWVRNKLPLDGLLRASIELAAQGGHTAVLKWWKDQTPPIEFDFADSTIVSAIVRKGQLATLRWWKSHMPPELLVFTSDHWVVASENGHCSILQFAQKNRYTLPESTSACIDKAAEHGHVDVLDWWYHNVGRKQVLNYTVDAMDKASANGHVAVLEWFSQSGLELRFTPYALQAARRHGHFEIVAWWNKCRVFGGIVAGNRLPINVPMPTDFVMLCAFGYSEFLSAKSVAKQAPTVLEHALHVACRHGQVHILQLLAPGCDLRNHPSNVHFQCAVEHNQPAALQWCFRNPPRRMPHGEWWLPCVKTAFERGYVEVLEILRGIQILSWKHFGCDYVKAACQGGQVQSLSFLHESIAPADSWDLTTCFAAVASAAAHGHVAVLQWLFDRREDAFLDRGDSWRDVIHSTSDKGHVAVLEWWVNNNLPFDFAEDTLWHVAEHGKGEVIEWWIKSGKVEGLLTFQMLKAALDNASESKSESGSESI